MPDSVITLRTRADLAALTAARSSFNVLTAEEQKAERAALSLAQNMARLDAKLGDVAGGAARLKTALQNAAYIDPGQAVGALNQIISLEKQAAAESARLSKAGGLQILPRTVESFGTQALDQFKNSLLGIAGPAALVTGGLQLLSQAAQEAEQSFKLKAALDQTTSSIELQLRGVRDSGATFASAAQFADRYKFTQEETNAALRGSVSILRTSKSSAEDLLGVLARLQVLSPEQGLEGASLALKELSGGDIQSLVERFEVSRSAANKMKAEIAGGADAVQVLARYLDNSGVSMDALAVRAEGAAGKMNQLRVETEKQKLALAGGSGGIGEFILDVKIKETQKSTRILSGDLSDLRGPITNAAAGYNPLVAILDKYIFSVAQVAPVTAEATAATDSAAAAAAYYAQRTAEAAAATAAAVAEQAAALAQTGGAYDAYTQAANAAGIANLEAAGQINFMAQAATISAEASILDAAQKEMQANKTALLAAQTQATVDAFLRLNPGIDASAAASLAAAEGYSPQIQRLIAMQIEADNAAGALGRLNIAQGIAAGAAALKPENRRIGGFGNTVGAIAGGIGGGAGATFSQVDGDQRALQNSRDALALSNAKTNADKIAIYQRQLDRQTTEAGRNRIQAQINSLRGSGGGSRGAPAGGRGLSTLDRTDIALAGDESARLAEINKRLETGRLTELQRKQLTAEKLKLEEKVGDAIRKQNEAIVDAQLLSVRNQQETIKEDRELAALKRRQDSGEFSPEQKRDAALREQEILLERQKHAIDIGDKALIAGVPVAAGAAPQAANVAPAANIAPQAGGSAARLGVFLDSKEVGYILIPEVMRALASGAATVQAAGG